MSNGQLNFSVVFQAVTQAFNAGIKGASKNYQDALDGMNSATEQLSRRSESLSSKIQTVFKAGSAREILAAFKELNTELANTAQGATITTSEFKVFSKASKAAVAELSAELKQARANLALLRTQKAAPEDIEKARQKVVELSREVINSKTAYSAFQKEASFAMQRAAFETDKLKNSSKEAATAIYKTLNIRTGGEIRRDLNELNVLLANFKKNSGLPAEEVKRVTAAASARIKELNSEAKGSNSMFTQLAGSIRGVAPAAAALTGVTLGLAGIKSSMEAVIESTMRYQATLRQMQYGSGGSLEKAGQEYEWLLGLTQKLGIELTGAADGYAQLTAATKNTAMEGEKSRQLFEGISSAAAALNLSAGKTQGVMLSLTQIMSKGKVSMEELRNQLAEHLPGAMRIAADSIGVTSEEFAIMVEQGLDSVQFMEKFGPALQKAFGPLAQQNLNTLNGQVNLLNSRFEQLKYKIGLGGLGAAATQVFKDMGNAIENIVKWMDGLDPTLVDAVKASFAGLYDVVSEVFEALLGAAGDSVGAINDLLNSVTSLITGLAGVSESTEEVSFLARTLQGISIILGALADGVKAIGIAFTLATGVVESFFSAVALGLSKVTFGNLSKELEEFSFKMQDAAQRSFDKANQKALDFKSSAVEAADRAVGANAEAATKTAEIQEEAADRVGKAHERMGDSAEASAGKGVDAHKDATDKTAKVHEDAAGRVSAAQGKIGDSAKEASTRIKLSSVEGEDAIVKITNASDDTVKALRKLAKESGVSLPVVSLNAGQIAQVLGEVAVKSEVAADALGKNLEEALKNLKADDLSKFWDNFIIGMQQSGASTEQLNAAILKLATEASTVLGADLSAAMNKTTESFDNSRVILDKLTASMGVLKTQGVDTGIALSNALDAMLGKAKNSAEINVLIGKWEELGRKGLISGQQMSEGLEAARKKMDDLTPGVNSVNEALRDLGQSANDSAANLQAKYQRAFDYLKDSGVGTFKQISAALKTMLDAANDRGSLERLAQSFKELGYQGKLASYDVKKGLADVRNKLDEMKPGINSVAEAMKTLGMASREESAAMADKYRQAFNVMRNSGTATSVELSQAFQRYAEAAIQANGGIADGFIKSQAAAYGFKVSVDESGKSMLEAASKSAAATDDLSSGLDDVAAKYGKVGDAAQAAALKSLAAKEQELAIQERMLEAEEKRIELENKQNQVDRDGFKTNKSGNRISEKNTTWLSIFNDLKGYGLDEAAARSIAGEFTGTDGKVPFYNNQAQLKYGGKNSSIDFAVMMAAQEWIKNSGGGGGIGGAATGSARATGGSAAEPEVTKVVNVNLKGDRRTVGLQVSAADAEHLIDMLSQSQGLAPL